MDKNKALRLFNRSEMGIPTGYDRRTMNPIYRQTTQDPEYFDEIFRRLPKEKQKELAGLLKKCVDTKTAAKKGEIFFKVDKIEKQDNDRFKVHFLDNLHGNTLLFVPTLEYISGILGDNRYSRRKDFLGNMVIKEWSHSNHMIEGEGQGYNTDPEIILYSPETYVENEGISIVISGGEGQAESYLRDFKTHFLEVYIPEFEAPIKDNIRELFKEGIELLDSDEEKMERISKRKEIVKVKGKIF